MSSNSESNLAMAKTVITTLGSVAATVMLARTIAQDYLPAELQDFLFSGIRKLSNRCSTQLTMAIDEYDGLVSNEIYEAAAVYLATRISTNNRRIKVSKPEKEKNIAVTMDRNEEVTDVYNGAKFKWVYFCQQMDSERYPEHSSIAIEARSFELTFHKKHREMALSCYLPHILKEAKDKKQERKSVKIFTIDHERMYDMSNIWTSVTLDHPASFDTLAMDAEAKEMVMKDLKRFVTRREHYRKVGKAWKRGYLLYGPPGTGKSSLIAAMANYLNFDVYDLELTEFHRNSDLRKVLLGTANRSILVVEDIDCTIKLQDRLDGGAPSPPHPGGVHHDENKVTLSGFLNFIDGLWSSCGDERIIVFTTNHKDKLDPALLRPGRMDVHIHMSYCTPCGFKLLAKNYLGIKDHELFGKIEEMIQTTDVTPAEVAEQLLKADDGLVDVTLGGLIDFLHAKKKENEEAKAKKEEIEKAEREQTDESENEEKK